MDDPNNGLSDKQEMALELVMSGMMDGEDHSEVVGGIQFHLPPCCSWE